MIEQLKEYIVKNGLHDRAIEDFWRAFNNWKNDNPEGYGRSLAQITPEELNLFVDTIGLRASQWPECDYSHVTITVLVYHGDRQLGRYVDWFALSDDDDDDDFLEIG